MRVALGNLKQANAQFKIAKGRKAPVAAKKPSAIKKAGVDRPISKSTALQIAFRTCTPDCHRLECFETLPEECRIFAKPEEPCWYVQCPWGDHMESRMLRAGRLMIISRRTGQVL
ncbi:MAG: hypothetical protein GX548_07565 [Lentisphaerae bacterium]|nr:hypothetical protein [Lentisphaerota bacterium]